MSHEPDARQQARSLSAMARREWRARSCSAGEPLRKRRGKQMRASQGDRVCAIGRRLNSTLGSTARHADWFAVCAVSETLNSAPISHAITHSGYRTNSVTAGQAQDRYQRFRCPSPDGTAPPSPGIQDNVHRSYFIPHNFVCGKWRWPEVLGHNTAEI
jgi:hypothetical protein